MVLKLFAIAGAEGRSALMLQLRITSVTYGLLFSALLVVGWADSVNECYSAEDDRLIDVEKPKFLQQNIGVLDPSIGSRRVVLPWDRESWCTLSPCLTVADDAQRAIENPNFERWVGLRQSGWAKPFAPLIHEQKDGMYWLAPHHPAHWTFYLRNSSHGFKYKEYVEPLLGSVGCQHWVNVTGKVLLWQNFYQSNYGHWIHNNAPAILSLLHIMGDSVAWVALPQSQLSKRWLCWFNPDLLRRIIYYPPGKVICTNSTTLLPLNKYGKEPPHGWSIPSSLAVLNREAHRLHFHAARFTRRKIPTFVFASRNSPTVKHGRKLVNEPQVLDTIRRLMKAYNRPEELVIYNGEGVSFADQFEIFSTASIIMGPHGSAMSNVLWTHSHHGCCDPVRVIEIVGGFESGPRVQDKYHGYYKLEAAVPWVTYHMLTFEPNSTRLHTSVSLADVETVLSYIWGGIDNGSTSCQLAVRH